MSSTQKNPEISHIFIAGGIIIILIELGSQPNQITKIGFIFIKLQLVFTTLVRFKSLAIFHAKILLYTALVFRLCTYG